MEFFLKQDAYNKKIYDLVAELPDRVQAIINVFPDRIAEDVLNELIRTAPKDIPRYPKMLKLVQLDAQGIDSTVGIIVPGYEQSYRLRASDAAAVLLYVKPREFKNQKPDPGAVILAEHSPWTMATLPYEIHRMQGSIKSRRVHPREVQKIEKKRKSELPTVVRKLKDVGIYPKRTHPVLMQRRVTRDVAFEVLRKEFGINTKHQAHWRPALRAARRKYVGKTLMKLVRWLTVPSERRWKKRVTRKREKASTIRRIQSFQDYIAAGGR